MKQVYKSLLIIVCSLIVNGCSKSSSTSVELQSPVLNDILNGDNDLDFTLAPKGPEESVSANIIVNATDPGVSSLSLPGGDPIHFAANKMMVFSDSYINNNVLVAGSDTEGVFLFDVNLETNLTQKIDKKFKIIRTQDHVVSGDYVYFIASDENTTGLWELNRSTYAVNLIRSASLTLDRSLIEFDGHIFFSSRDDTLGSELFSYNLSTRTAGIYSDIYSGSNSSSPTSFIKHNGKLFFIANLSVGDRIHSLSDSSSTPVRLTPTEGLSHIDVSRLKGIAALGGFLYFNARSTDVEAGDFFKYEISTGIYSLASRINNVDTTGSRASGFTAYNGKIYFSAHDGQRLGANGTELWTYDPITEAATLVSDVYPGKRANGSEYPNNGSPGYFTVRNNKLYFSALSSRGGVVYSLNSNSVLNKVDIEADKHLLLVELGDNLMAVETDGSNAYIIDSATNAVENKIFQLPEGEGASRVFGIQVFDELVVFTQYHHAYGYEPWIYNTQTNVITQISDILPGKRSSNSGDFQLKDDTLAFRFLDANGDYRLGMHDIKTRETIVSKAQNFYVLQRLHFIGDNLVFQGAAYDVDTSGPFVFNLKTGVLKHALPGAVGAEEYVQLNNKLFFSVRAGLSNEGLWEFDSTTGNTKKLSSRSAKNLRVNQGALYYIEHDGSGYIPIVYKYDIGKEAETVFKDFSASDGPTRPFYMGFHKNKMFLKLETVDFGAELYIFDPADDSLELIDVTPGPDDTDPSNFVSYGNKVYFAAGFGSVQSQWVYDDVTGAVTQVNSIENGRVDGESVHIRRPNISGGKLYVPLYGNLSIIDFD